MSLFVRNPPPPTYNNVINTSNSKHVCNHYSQAMSISTMYIIEQTRKLTLGSNTGSTLTLALLAVREIRKHGSNTLTGADTGGLNHDAKLNNVVVHVVGARLDDKNIFVTNRNACRKE